MSLRVLLVDDSLLDVVLIRQALRECCGIVNVTTAGDGQEASRLLSELCFDLMLLDLQMPGVDGFELLSRFQERPTDLPPTVVLSGQSETAEKERALSLGAMAYVIKGMDFSLMKLELAGALRRHGFC